MFGFFRRVLRSVQLARPWGGPWIKALFFAAAVLSASSPAVAQEAGHFIAGIEDLPVMPGLTEIPEAGLVFDKPAGRIVEAYAQGEGRKQAVLDFYRRTLPELGWHLQADDRYAREGEELTLQVRENDSDSVVVMFRLAPK
jgi:hypothetical protein